MKKILVVNVNWMGDVIFSSPIFKAIKEAYPQAQICCLAPSRIREIVESIPGIDEMIDFQEKGKHWSPWGKWQLIQELRRRKFDAAFLLHRSLTRALLVFLAGIPLRVGYDTKGRGIFLTHKVPALNDEKIHRQDHYLKVIESFGIQVTDRQSRLMVDKGAQEKVKQILEKNLIRENDVLAVVNPGGNWHLKRWPPQNFSILIDRLLKEFKVKVILSGSSQDVFLAEQITRPLDLKPVILTGQLNLKELMALMQRARWVVSADTGPLHLANSVGTAVVGIFGPTRPENTGPRGKGPAFILQRDIGCNRVPCYYLECPDNTCMQAVTVKDVLDAIQKFQHS